MTATNRPIGGPVMRRREAGKQNIMGYTFRMACRIALAAWVAFVGCAALAAAPRTIAAASSTWYWQNPLPRAYSMQAISCPSVKACVTVGLGGSITTTTDGGRHWTSRRSRTIAALFSVACPGRSVCYALGSAEGTLEQVADVLLKSVDGGATWSRPSQHLSLGVPVGAPEGVPVESGRASLVCPTTTTCLLWSVTRGASHILRTGDGGRTWQDARGDIPQGGGPITCPTTRICYAGTGDMLLRSLDAGATWKVRSRVPGSVAGSVGALVCPQASSCLAALDVCLGCGDAFVLRPRSRTDASSQEWVDIFLTQDGGRTWRHVDRGGIADAELLVCGSATRCYGTGACCSEVLETIDGGQTWSSHRSPFTGYVPEVTCPGAITCYATAAFTALKTMDGFRHVRQEPARSSIGGADLTGVMCPTTTTCYASDSSLTSMAATRDGGKRWTAMPRPLINYLSCPSRTTCYGATIFYPGGGQPPTTLLYRTSDGTRSWQQFTIPVPPFTGPGGIGIVGVTCVDERTCYLLVTTSVNASPSLSFLVTTDGGATWQTKRNINSGTAPGNLSGGALSCPSALTCFVALRHGSGKPGTQITFTFLATTNAGDSWTRPSPVPCALSCHGSGIHLACPTVTTCYVVSTDVSTDAVSSSSPTMALVTHDAGVTWHSAEVSRGGFLTDIACPDAQTCRVVGWSGIYGTQDGGATWHKQAMEGKQPFPLLPPPGLTGIACPAVATCYAVGQEDILATHPPR